MADEFEYSGRDNLEVMREAKNYNAFLSKLVENHCAGWDRVVDFGAGIGTFSNSLGNRVVCVEPDALNRRELEVQKLYHVADIEDLEDGYAQAMFSINVLEHIENDRDVLGLLAKKMSDSGRLLIYVPAMPVLFSEMDRKVGHYRRYKKRDLAKKLEAAGLTIESIRYADTLGVLATLLYKATGGNGEINPSALRIFDRFIFPMNFVLDALFGWGLGKNLVAVAVKKG